MSIAWLTYICPNDECGEIEIEAEIEPGEMYGTDADGNRGVWVGPYVVAPEPPDACPECKEKYTEDHLAAIQADLEVAVNEWNEHAGDDDGPEYDPMKEIE